MIDAAKSAEAVQHVGFGPGEFPQRWREAAYDLHCQAWPSVWQGQTSRERFLAELDSDHADALCEANGGNGRLLAYVKWKATEQFHLSRDELSDPAEVSMSSAPPAGYVCAYEITATADRSWRGLGRRLLSEAMTRWEVAHGEAVYCTYSPKRGLTSTLRRLAETEQHGQSALAAFAHRAAAIAARHIDDWVAQLGQSLEEFLRDEILPVPDEQVMAHLDGLRQRFGSEVIDGVVAAVGMAYNFVLRASTGQPACGPAAFHRALGAEHWRQYPASATNCADALGLVDHWRYSHDPARRQKCARWFKEVCQRAVRAQGPAEPRQLVVLD